MSALRIHTVALPMVALFLLGGSWDVAASTSCTSGYSDCLAKCPTKSSTARTNCLKKCQRKYCGTAG
jgi:hypothetical protein